MPDAELFLAKAREGIRAGEKLLEAREYREADMHFERAEADAETALSLARAHQAEAEATTAEAQLDGFSIEGGERQGEGRRDVEVEVNVDAD